MSSGAAGTDKLNSRAQKLPPAGDQGVPRGILLRKNHIADRAEDLQKVRVGGEEGGSAVDTQHRTRIILWLLVAWMVL